MRKLRNLEREKRMDFLDSVRRWAGWMFLGLVAALASMGYHFENVRFVPLAAGFAILSAVCFLDRGRQQVRSTNGVHPGADSGIHRASR
jgi:hypothetical protein